MRLRAYGVLVSLLAGVLLPLGWPVGRDDFPVSSYPMFTHKRDRVMETVHVLALAADGSAQPVAPEFVANGAVMQAAATIGRAIALGNASALCERVARNLSKQARVGVNELSVATSTYDTVVYFRNSGGRLPLQRVEHARCPVPHETDAP